MTTAVQRLSIGISSKNILFRMKKNLPNNLYSFGSSTQISLRKQSTTEQFNASIDSTSTKVIAQPARRDYANRFLVSAEVTISKIFPAGFGWQYGSVIAGDMGYQASDVGFALMTGAGDFAGVLIGHSTFYAIKSLYAPEVNVSKELHTGLFLASAAFFSGGAWQPIVNTLQSAGYSYVGVTGVTTIVCASAFLLVYAYLE